ncbi:S8 family peptidase [Psychromicrobium lacuslunae]|uniref:S8 family peptidase n=1 Tax=Psychromicrobium lacuslunae TaxID=1618207 RepID=UPI000698C459|nr:S8 family serine peptidase [Psychromicrobium lacuslunae]
MTQASKRHVRTVTLAGLTGIALLCGTGLQAQATEAPKNSVPESNNSVTVPADKISGNLATAKGPVSVFVQFSGQGAFAATQPQTVKEKSSAPVNAAPTVKKIRTGIEQTAQSVTSQASAKKLYTTTNTLPGVAINGDAAAIRDLAKRTDVVKITPIVPKSIPDNKSTDIDTRALNTWAQTGQTGKGIKIAVVDSGLDYTHTDFGGPGTAEAYKTAGASATLVPGTYDPNKFLGGYDLAGDDYDANPDNPTYQPIPHPDANPLDCVTGGHGTHVAGTAAGYGVNEDGSTFTAGQNGSPKYSDLTAAQVNGLRIGPGSAPEAGLYSFRVFGCVGSTNLVIDALDKVLDPNGDGNFSDRADIVNMSLGSDYTPTDDPENDVINELTKTGVLSVVASGNAGDFYDIGGSPGNAKTSLTVANSIGSQAALDRIDVLAPAVDKAAGQYSSNFDYSAPSVTPAQLTGTVVMGPSGANADGCAAFSAEDAAKVKGKWVWLSWDDNDATRKCGSAVRYNNAQAAGATGVVFDSTRDVFAAGIAGNAGIPGVQFTKTYSDKYRAAAAAGTLQLQLKSAYRGTAGGDTNALDTLNPGSSRGVHGSNGVVKPDVAAPGTSIGSAGVGTGNGANVKSGTSMSTPHVAGIAALVMAQTKLSALQVKSIVMNTATHDLFKGQFAFGPNRVGSGRVDALNATTTNALAYATDDPELTSVNFGVLELADKPLSITKSVTVKSFGGAARNYAIKYLPATTIPGVEYVVSPSVNVPSGRSATFTVTLKIADPKALRKTLDPTMDATQLDTARQFIAEASGRVELSSVGAPSLRVPVYAAPKPTSAMTAGSALNFGTGTKTPVSLTGRVLEQGNVDANGYNGLVAPFELQTQSPRIDKLDETAAPDAKENLAMRAMDLQNVGVSSTIPALKELGGDVKDGEIAFGISTWGNWAALTKFMPVYVDIDTNNDGVDDFQLRTGTASGLDLPLVIISQYQADGSAKVIGNLPLNGVDGSLDSNTMDSNVMKLSVPASILGIDGSKPAPFTYTVTTYSIYKEKDGNLVPVDQTAPVKYDPVNPALWFEDGSASTLFFDRTNAGINAYRAPGNTTAKALFLHFHNATGDLSATGNGGKKAEIVPIKASNPAAASVYLAPSTVFQSTLTVAIGQKFAANSAIKVTAENGATLATGKSDSRGNVIILVKLPKSLGAGSHTLTLTDATGKTASAKLTVKAWPSWPKR